MHHRSLFKRNDKCRLWNRSTRTTCHQLSRTPARVDNMEYWTNSASRCAAESLPRPSMAVRQPFAGANWNAAVESQKTHGNTQALKKLFDLFTRDLADRRWVQATLAGCFSPHSRLDSDSSGISFQLWGLLGHRHRLCHDNILFLQKRAAANATRRSSA
jgi:hypothetical protein